MGEIFDFNQTLTKRKLQDFAEILRVLDRKIGKKVSSRGWCYLMEQSGYIDKSQFDKVENAVNRCRKEGLIPVDFVAENAARTFANLEQKSDRSIKGTLEWMLSDVLNGSHYYTPDWWEGEEFYIQVVVEKIDLKTFFQEVCNEYHIPIANAAGWQSISQRAEYTKRFKQAEKMGLKPVLLYGGDFDPDGIRITEAIRENLRQVKDVRWSDGTPGYDPKNLIIKRFCLEYDFIEKAGYTWIDNLKTGSGGELARIENGQIVQGRTANGKPHQNFNMPYLQEYLHKYGVRKCEANAIVTTPDLAYKLMRDTIESIVGKDALKRFQAKIDKVEELYQQELEKLNLRKSISLAVKTLKDEVKAEKIEAEKNEVEECPICGETDYVGSSDDPDFKFFCSDCEEYFDSEPLPSCPSCEENRNVDKVGDYEFRCNYCEISFDEDGEEL